MLGKTHLKLGIISAATVAAVMPGYVSLQDAIGAITIAGVSSILTSQLADLDSESSKISQIIPVINYLKNKTGMIIDVILSAICFILYFSSIKDNRLIFAGVFFSVFFLFKIIIKFLFTHRKFTHSLIAVALIAYPCLSSIQYISEPAYKSLMIGLTVGYASHIVFDSFTVKGTYLLWPIPIRISVYHWKAGKEDDAKSIKFAYILSMITIVGYYFYPYIFIFLQK